MAEESFSGRIQDVSRFALIAERLLRGGYSMRDIAAELGVSNTSLADTVRRLEKKWDCKLLVTKPRSSDSSQLSSDGIRLYERLRDLLRSGVQTRPHPVSVHIAHSLLTSQVLAPAIAQFLAEQKDVRQAMAFQTEAMYQKVVLDLQTEQLDLAVTWSFPNAYTGFPNDIEYTEFGPEIPLVMICRNAQTLKDLINHDEVNFDVSEKYHLARLSKERQPPPAGAPFDWMDRPSSVEVDSFDAIVAFVRSGMADFGIVPSICCDLDRYVATGELSRRYISGASIKLAILARAGGMQALPPEARRLMNGIKNLLECTNLEAKAKENFQSPMGIRSRFSTDNDWYLAIKHGYYIDQDRERRSPAAWHWQEVEFTPTNSKLVFNGKICNSDRATFTIHRASVVGELFYIAAQKTNREPKAVDSFVSVFTWCSQIDGIMYGLWAGVDLEERPAVYGTIFSQRVLTESDVRAIAKNASVSLVLSSPGFDHFARQQ